jgi:hypothetical protein
VKLISMQTVALIGAAIALASMAGVAAGATPSPTSSAHAHAVTATSKAKHKKKKKKKAVGPSLSVIGFGVNRLYVPNGATITSSRDCDEIVGADSPVGPPQNVYLLVYLRATDIPADAPTQIADTLPDGDDLASDPTLSPPTPWSKAFAKGGFGFGSPDGDQADLFHGLIVSASDEEGSGEGPSAEEFDGTYSYTATTEVGPHKLTSTAKVTVDCPLLR